MSSEAKIAFFDIGNSNSSLSGGSLMLPADLNTGLFQLVYQSKARVFTNSWGSTSNNYDSLAVQVDTFMYTYKDALVLFSAGNLGGNGAHTVSSPATNKNGVAVGATLNDHDSWLAYEGGTDEAYGMTAVAGFSSQGPTADMRMKPDILAPGFWTTSAYGSYNTTKNLCDVQILRGTSMACPTAAGFALKIRRFFLDGFYPGGVRNASAGFSPSGALLKACLVHSTQRMNTVVATDSHDISDITGTFPSNVQGYGRIKMSAVLNFATSQTSPVNFFVVGSAFSPSPHYAAITSTAKVDKYTFTCSPSNQVRVTFTYTDYPGSTLTSQTNGQAVINKLQIVVTTDTGDTHNPYLASGVVADNLQVIDISSPVAGAVYTVTVSSTLLPHGPQPYALVITGAMTYISDPGVKAATSRYTAPQDPFTVDGDALKFIVTLSLSSFILLVMVVGFHRMGQHKAELRHPGRDNSGLGIDEDHDMYEDD